MTNFESKLDRVGVEIRLRGTWRETVAHYAKMKNLATAAIMMYDDLISRGLEEPWAALETLSTHGCCDLILGNQHLKLSSLGRN